jgi:hypothetical protein
MAEERKFKWEKYTVIALYCMTVYLMINLVQYLKNWNFNYNETLSWALADIKIACAIAAIILGYMGANKIKNDSSFPKDKEPPFESPELLLARLAYIAGYAGLLYYPIWIWTQLSHMH